MEMGVPSGYRFLPTEEELLGYYLNSKVYSDPMNNNLNNVIPDHYDVFHTIPEDLPGDRRDKRYFFVRSSEANKLNIISNSGGECGGYWEAIGTEEDIEVVYKGKQVHAMKRLLVFYRETDLPTPWIMHEYHLVHSDDSIPNSTKKYSRAKDDWVVCVIREKKSDNDSDSGSEEMWVSGPCVMDLTSEEDDSELHQPSSSSSSSSSSCSSGVKQPCPKESDQEVCSY
ncbi:NAC domain-containing protein 104-like [Cornus florida]|uniref:NAC domain-containing protein 104-like n=1 Tax=Cornus florida TaxID=4283 RepID=UPI00289CB787|nr:NAC domain-containing protein 104-like [Cornus florida]